MRNPGRVAAAPKMGWVHWLHLRALQVHLLFWLSACESLLLFLFLLLLLFFLFLFWPPDLMG